MRWVVNATTGRFNLRKDPVLIVLDGGWAPGPVWTGSENLAPSGFDPRTVRTVASRYTWPTLAVFIPTTCN